MADKFTASVDDEVWATRKDKSKAAKGLLGCSTQACIENCYKASRAYTFATLFTGYTLNNLQGYGANVSADLNFPGLNFPIIKNRCRTLAKTFIAKSFANDRPEPQFTTKGGNFDQVIKADLMNDLLIADFSESHGAYSNIHSMHCMGGLIATTATGRYFVFCIDYESSTYPECELDDSLTIGIWRAQQHGAIRMLTRVVWMNPEEAVRRMGKKHATAIYKNVEERNGAFVAGRGLSDVGSSTVMNLSRRVVKIIQGWSVQVGDVAGREMFILKDEYVLRDKPYTKRKPPCTYWDFETALDGEDPIPLTQAVYRLSMYQNRIINDVDYAERNTPQVLLAAQNGTKGQGQAGKAAATKSLLQTKAIQIIETDGPASDAFSFVGLNKYAKDSVALEKMYDDAIFEESQIGRNHATGTKPEGTQSGIQESLAASYYTETFAEAERRSIDCRAIETPTIMLWVTQKLAKRPKGFTKWVGSNEFRQQVKHTDLDLDEDKYIIGIKAVGEGKDSPKTRMDKAMQLLKDPTVQFVGADLVQTWKTYDVDRIANRAFALEEWTEDQIKRYLKLPLPQQQDPSFYQPPEIWMQLSGLRVALAIMTKGFLDARQQNAPPERTKWFEKFCNDCVALIQVEEKREALNNAGKSVGSGAAPIAGPVPGGPSISPLPSGPVPPQA